MAIVSLTLLETAKTANNTKKLPKLAAITMLHLETSAVAKNPPKILEPKMTNATPKLAPELSPKTKGPANGFLNKVCISNPEMPRPEPTKMAVIAFGSLKSITITSQVVFSMVPKRLPKILSTGILTEPKLILIKKHINKIATSSEN